MHTAIVPRRAFLAMLVILVAGVSSTSAQAKPTVGLAGCKYITEAEATQALGAPSHYRSNDGESSNCIIDPVADTGLSVDFNVTANRGSYNYWAGQDGVTPLSGLGDKAIWSLQTPQMGVLAFMQGGKSVVITVTGPATAVDLKAKAAVFALKVLTHL